jgi:hypothetical protein
VTDGNVRQADLVWKRVLHTRTDLILHVLRHQKYDVSRQEEEAGQDPQQLHVVVFVLKEEEEFKERKEKCHYLFFITKGILFPVLAEGTI